MSIPRVKIWNPGDILTAADLNSEFNNVVNNLPSIADSSLSFVTASGSVTPRRLNDRAADVINVMDYGAKRDNATDDTVVIQNALNQGGYIILNGPGTYLVNSANLTLSANTTFYIQKGAVLHLAGTRLTALNVNDVSVLLHGIISSTTLNTTDALPTDWNARGVVEFGGTAASPSQRVGIVGPGKVTGDFAGTPGAIAIAFQDKRRGIVLTNVVSGWCQHVKVSGTVGEGIWYSGGANDRDIDISYNAINACNHDAISSESFSAKDIHIHHNQGWNCASGIESVDGVIENNLMRDMVVGGSYIFGGNTPLNTVVIRNNIGYNSTTVDFSLAGATSPGGIVIVEGNLSVNSGTAAYSFQYITNAKISNNIATGWGRTGAGVAFGIGGHLTNAEVTGNLCYSAGANSIGGFTVDTTTNLTASNNYAPGVATPFTNLWEPNSSANHVVPTASLPAASAFMDGTVLLEDNGAGNCNLVAYKGGQRFHFVGALA